MNSFYILLGQGLLTLLSCLCCYFLGKRTVQNEREKERADSLSAAHKARESLRDPSVVERLHAKYKR